MLAVAVITLSRNKRMAHRAPEIKGMTLLRGSNVSTLTITQLLDRNFSFHANTLKKQKLLRARVVKHLLYYRITLNQLLLTCVDLNASLQTHQDQLASTGPQYN